MNNLVFVLSWNYAEMYAAWFWHSFAVLYHVLYGLWMNPRFIFTKIYQQDNVSVIKVKSGAFIFYFWLKCIDTSQDFVINLTKVGIINSVTVTSSLASQNYQHAVPDNDEQSPT